MWIQVPPWVLKNKYTMIHNKCCIGTEMKLNISVDPLGEITMDDYDFEVEVFCIPQKKIEIIKEDSIRIDENNYIILVDSSKLGIGKVKVKFTAYIPDVDFDDGYRTEVLTINTGISIIRSV